MARIPLAGVMTGPPREFPRKNWDTGELLPGKTFQHVVMIEGQPYKFSCDEDLTQSLNGQREQLEASDPVKITAHVELYSGRGNKPGAKLVALEPRK